MNPEKDWGSDTLASIRYALYALNADLTPDSTPTCWRKAKRVRRGIGEALLNGKLRGKPTLIVAGRSDAPVPINHASRAYSACNRNVEGAASQLSYIEVTNAQHFEAFLPFSGVGNRFVPLHVCYNRAMDAMYAKLKNGSPLPPSQVVRTTPRGGTPGAAPAITAPKVPNFVATPAAGDLIVFTGG
jgi:hydroxybutyrate-dimer hydrolase